MAVFGNFFADWIHFNIWQLRIGVPRKPGNDITNNGVLNFINPAATARKNITINSYAGGGVIGLQAAATADDQWVEKLNFVSTPADSVNVDFYFTPNSSQTYLPTSGLTFAQLLAGAGTDATFQLNRPAIGAYELAIATSDYQNYQLTSAFNPSLGKVYSEVSAAALGQIANAYTAVAIEGLNMRGMAQSLNLAKSTNDNGFGRLKTFLAYKLAEQGKPLVIIDKWFPSSKLCRFCHNENKELTLADRTWAYKDCGAELDRDINAAINIKNEGCRLLGIA